MSTAPAPAPATPAAAGPPPPNEVTVISHSNLFYWWPVWAVGLVLALLTRLEDSRLAVVPGDSRAGTIPISGEIDLTHFDNTTKDVIKARDKDVKLVSGSGKRDEVVVKQGTIPVIVQQSARADAKTVIQDENPKIHITRHKEFGVLFVTVLLLVIVITNVPLRGLWSVIVIVIIIALSVIFALAGWWNWIFNTISALDIRINMGGYLTISIGLAIAWLVTMLFFDRQVYVVFEANRFRVCTEIGGGEKIYDTRGLTLERQRGDIFRHYFLGLGSGDMTVKTTGAQAHHFDLYNVLFIKNKMQQIERLLGQTGGDVKR